MAFLKWPLTKKNKKETYSFLLRCSGSSFVVECFRSPVIYCLDVFHLQIYKRTILCNAGLLRSLAKFSIISYELYKYASAAVIDFQYPPGKANSAEETLFNVLWTNCMRVILA